MSIEDKPTFDKLPELVSELHSKVDTLLSKPNTEPVKETKEWMDLQEVCEYLPGRPAIDTVYGWVHKRHIPFGKRGKNLYFRKSEIDEWLKGGRVKTAAEIAAEADSFKPKKRA